MQFSPSLTHSSGNQLPMLQLHAALDVFTSHTASFARNKEEEFRASFD